MSPSIQELRGEIEGRVLHLVSRYISHPLNHSQLIQAALRPIQPDAAGDLDPVIHALADPLRLAMQQQYETEKQVARRLNVSVKTLQNARWRGTGPIYRHPLGFNSRAVRYNTLELEVWLLHHAVKSTAEAALRGSQGNG